MKTELEILNYHLTKDSLGVNLTQNDRIIHAMREYAGQLRQPLVSGSVLEQIRQSFADYRRAEGCSCCRDMDAHEEAEKRLADLLKPEPYEDGSGWDWSKYRTDR